MFSSKSKNVRICWVILAFQVSCQTRGSIPADLLKSQKCSASWCKQTDTGLWALAYEVRI